MPRTHLAGVLIALCGVALHTHVAAAAGPLAVNGAGQPLVWTTRPIPYNPDRGTLGTMDNASAVQFVSDRFATWAAVPTASISFTDAGLLPVDVTVSNAAQYFGVCGDHLDPIVFDTDGSIIRNFFGIGNENFILGAAGPDCATYTPPVIIEASAILNGRFVDGINNQLNPEISLADFQGVFTHEFGHYIGLDHSQINLTEAFDDDPSDDNAVATMFPILVNGHRASACSTATTKSPRRCSTRRRPFSPPAVRFAARFCGPTAAARFRAPTSSPGRSTIRACNAVGVASGFLYAPTAPGGPPPASLKGYYELNGLSPASIYTVEIESVNARFVGGSSIGPVDPPIPVPVAEFWNGANEAATNPPDDPSAAVPIAVTAGSPVNGINIVMNSVSGALPPNDLCDQATVISSLPFTDSLDTTGATESVTDPVQTCTGSSTNSDSLWYTMTAPNDGILTVDTCGSDYDTVLSAYSGTCGALSAVACDDDVGANDATCGSTQSRISVAVFAGQPYMIEVTQFNTPHGGNLVLHASIGPRSCAAGACLPGRGSASTECMGEWLVDPAPVYSGRPPSRIVCHDGDSCDADGDTTNHSCTFHVALCLNNHDPSLTKCTPTDAALVEVLKPNRNGTRNRPEDTSNADALLNAVAAITSSGGVRGICKNRTVAPTCTTNADCNSPGKTDGRCYVFVRFDPSDTAADRCGPAANIVVPLRVTANGVYRGVSKRLRLRTSDSNGSADNDSLTLRCVPAL